MSKSQHEIDHTHRYSGGDLLYMDVVSITLNVHSLTYRNIYHARQYKQQYNLITSMSK